MPADYGKCLYRMIICMCALRLVKLEWRSGRKHYYFKHNMKKSIQAKANTLKAKDKVQECEQLIQEALANVQELERAEQQALEEEKASIDLTAEQIRKICEDNRLFCGMILGPQDLVNIMQVMLVSKENVKVNFALYSIDN